jgi:hypothetical protein
MPEIRSTRLMSSLKGRPDAPPRSRHAPAKSRTQEIDQNWIKVRIQRDRALLVGPERPKALDSLARSYYGLSVDSASGYDLDAMHRSIMCLEALEELVPDDKSLHAITFFRLLDQLARCVLGRDWSTVGVNDASAFFGVGARERRYLLGIYRESFFMLQAHDDPDLLVIRALEVLLRAPRDAELQDHIDLHVVPALLMHTRARHRSDVAQLLELARAQS